MMLMSMSLCSLCISMLASFNKDNVLCFLPARLWSTHELTAKLAKSRHVCHRQFTVYWPEYKLCEHKKPKLLKILYFFFTDQTVTF